MGREGPDETVRTVAECSEYAYFVYRLECIFSLDATVVSWSVYRFFFSIYQSELIPFQGSNSFNLPFVSLLKSCALKNERTCSPFGYFRLITETRLFKYIENLTTKKKKNESFQIKILIFFIFLIKTQIVGTR